MAKKYKYKEVFYIADWKQIWLGILFVSVNGFFVTHFIQTNQPTFIVAISIAGVAAGIGAFGTAIGTKKKRVPISPQDVLKEDLKND